MNTKSAEVRYWDFPWQLGLMRMVGVCLPQGHWALARLEFVDQRHALAPASNWSLLNKPDALFQATLAQLNEYAAGARKTFELPLAPEGTTFQQAVWHQISLIAFGRARSYGDIASAVESPRASRAVGAATGRNPIGIIVPCHRVLGAAGSLTGYAGGLPRKIALLAFERGETASLNLPKELF